MSGVYVTTITPFHPDQSLDIEGIKKLIGFLVEQGIKHIVPLGTAGEFSSLTIDEKKQVIRAAADSAGGAEIIPGISSTSFEDVIDLARYAEDLGVSSALLLPPYYLKLNKGAFSKYFEAIASKCDLNFWIYNNPPYVGYDLTVEEIIELSRHQSVRGFKDARSNILELKMIVESVKNNKFVIEGLEEYALFGLLVGAQGYTSSLGNFLPEMALKIYNEFKQNNFLEVREVNELLLSYRMKMLESSQPLMMHFAKLGLKKRGIIKSDQVRLPLIAMTKEDKNIIEKVIDSLFEKFQVKV